MPSSLQIPVTEIELGLQGIYAAKAIGRREYDQLRVVQPDSLDAIVVQLIRWVAAYEANPPEGTLTVFASWYDFVKGTFGCWLRRWFPTFKFTTIRTKTYVATAFLPNVPLPAKLTAGKFTIWRYDAPPVLAEEDPGS